jgi:hypothetical protein
VVAQEDVGTRHCAGATVAKASIRTVRTILSFRPIFLGGRILGEMLSFICTFMCNASLGVVPARFDNARPLRSASTTRRGKKETFNLLIFSHKFKQLCTFFSNIRTECTASTSS